MADFCAINASYISNLSQWAKFVNGRDYVLRFVLDNWEPTTPTPDRLLSLVGAVVPVLATTNDLAAYNVKALILRQALPGESIWYWDTKSTAGVVLGNGLPAFSGCSNWISAGDRTWVLDLVFTANDDERSITHPSDWISFLGPALKGASGIPTVYIGGLVELDPTRTLGDEFYHAAAEFWASKQPFWNIIKTVSTGGGFKYTARPPTAINQAPSGKAWNRTPNYLGQDGVGVAYGDAFDPYNLGILSISAASSSNPFVNAGGNLLIPGLSTPMVLSTSEKAVGVLLGVVAGVGLARTLLR